MNRILDYNLSEILSRAKVFSLLVLFLASSASLRADEPGRHTLYEERERLESSWHFAPGINGGYNKLLSGWDGYENLGNAGLDLYVFPPIVHGSERPAWINNIFSRLSVDYFPLQVPEGVYGLKEDIAAITGHLLYQIKAKPLEHTIGTPFLGIGMGIYHDRIVLDTPATGKITGDNNYAGFVGSAGIMLPVFRLHWAMRLVPEVRYHRIHIVSDYSENMTYQVGLIIWPNF